MKKWFSVVLTVLFLLPGLVLAGQQGKIAVAANDKIPAASVSKQAGRSPFSLLFDEKGKLMETVPNPYKDAGSSGIAVADFLADKGATIIVAEEFGDRIIQVMKGKGIRAIAFKGSVAEAVKKVLQSN